MTALSLVRVFGSQMDFDRMDPTLRSDGNWLCSKYKFVCLYLIKLSYAWPKAPQRNRTEFPLIISGTKNVVLDNRKENVSSYSIHTVRFASLSLSLSLSLSFSLSQLKRFLGFEPDESFFFLSEACMGTN